MELILIDKQINTAEPQMPEPSVFEFEMAIENLKTQITSAYQIPGEMIKADGRTILSEIHNLLILFGIRRNLPVEWKESIIIPVYKPGDETDLSNYSGISLLSTTYKYPASFCQV
jgi:hypothetical protein